jgi:hypothetical protein
MHLQTQYEHSVSPLLGLAMHLLGRDRAGVATPTTQALFFCGKTSPAVYA